MWIRWHLSLTVSTGAWRWGQNAYGGPRKGSWRKRPGNKMVQIQNKGTKFLLAFILGFVKFVLNTEPPGSLSLVPCFGELSTEFSASVWILSPLFRMFELDPEDFYSDWSSSGSVNVSNSQESNGPGLNMLTVYRKKKLKPTKWRLSWFSRPGPGKGARCL